MKSATSPWQVNAHTPLDSLCLDWAEAQLPERERTKHVHRLHPYLGKYIPQLVEIFLRKFFTKGMTVLDPFVGSSTAIIQANELGMHSVGCDISAFNILIGSVKTSGYDLEVLRQEVSSALTVAQFEAMHLSGKSPVTASSYLRSWFAPSALRELLLFREAIPRYKYRDFLNCILSRSARSARLTTHFDLDFPKKPITEPYECYKHGRICRPTTTALKFIIRYCKDSFRRVSEFSQLRTPASIRLIHGDSRKEAFPPVDGVITSPLTWA